MPTNTSSAPPSMKRRMPAVPRPGANRPQSSAAEAERRQHERRREPEAGEARFRQCGALSHGGDRRHPRRAQRRAQACEERDDDPDGERDDNRPGLERQARCSGA